MSLEDRVLKLEKSVAILESVIAEQKNEIEQLKKHSNMANASNSSVKSTAKVAISTTPKRSFSPSSPAAASAASAASATPSSPSLSNGGGGSSISYFIQSRKITVLSPTSYVLPPAGHPALTAPPERSLQLEHVHGVKGRDAFSNLSLIDGGTKAVYYIASVVVVHEIATGKQKFLVGHTDDISCLAVDSTRRFAVSGQVAPKGKNERAFLVVWDLSTLTQVTKLGGKGSGHTSGVSCAAFSPNSDLIMSIGSDNEHTTFVWNVASGKIVQTATQSEKIFAVACNPVTGQWVSCGSKHISFWQVSSNDYKESRTIPPLTRKKGIFGKKGDQQALLSLAFNETGTHIATGVGKTGEIYVWDVATLELSQVADSASSASATDGNSVFSVTNAPNGHIISTSKDCMARIWKFENELKVIASVEIGVEAHSSSFDGSTFAVGATNHSATAFNLDLIAGKIVSATSLTSSHANEVWGLAIHPSKPLFATAADDKRVFVYSYERVQPILTANLPEAARSISFNSTGELLAVGFKNGGFAILNSETGVILGSQQDRKEEIGEIKFSPTAADILAVASHDNFIDVYQVQATNQKAEIQRKVVLKGHSSYLTHIDWSENGQFIQSTSGDYELLYWEALTGKRIGSATEMRNVSWASQNCVLGWPVSGIWPPDSDGTDVNAVDASPDRTLLATGSDDGCVRLFRYPAIEPGRNKMAPAVEMQYYHCAHVTNVRFSRDGQYLVSVGGNDSSVMVWKIV